MIKIGITQRVEFLEKIGERRDCLDQQWAKLLFQNGFFPIPLPNIAEKAKEMISILGLDGIILSGGNDLCHIADAKNIAPERDRFETSLLEQSIEQNLPVLGVCRGMQMMVTFHQGQLLPTQGHVAVLHDIIIEQKTKMPLMPRKVNSFHNFAVSVTGLTQNWQIAALSADGHVEALVHKELPHWAIMWHPERSPCDHDDIKIIQAFFKGK